MNLVTSMGGKASALHQLQDAGFPVPAWFIVLPGAGAEAVSAGLAGLRGAFFAVRSSAAGEDSAGHSFAGQLESWLFVPREEVMRRVEGVRESGRSERVLEYRRQRGLEGPPPEPAVIVQEMIDAECAGVAFSADPVSGRRDLAVVSAVPGLGTALVSGEADADSWKVSRSGDIVEASIVRKERSHRAAPDSPEGVTWQAVQNPDAPCLADAQVKAVAALARQAEAFFGRPQDIEWAWRDGVLYLLQSRPVTSLQSLPDPGDSLCLWDNSNISESYSGVTTPLTFSFARRAYENVYREFCRLLSVPESRIAASAQVYSGMLGLIRGRIYYNLLNWYRVLAMLPGFRLNRRFMEQMMGVREPLPEELVERVVAEQKEGSRFREWLRLLRSLIALWRKHVGLAKSIQRFYERLNTALAEPAVPLTQMKAGELTAHYRQLEEQLLCRWDAPLVNDFFAMIHFGVLRSLCRKWLGNELLANTLVRHTGGIVSMEPLHRIEALAGFVREDLGLQEELARPGGMHRFRRWPEFHRELEAYLERFGDRCMEELKLESATLRDQPALLYNSILAVSSRPRAKREEESADEPRLRGWLRRRVFGWVLRRARERVRDRENLRFERTRLFGRVRQIMVEYGRRLHADGMLETPGDVFFLELHEITGLEEAAVSAEALRATVEARKSAFAGYRSEEPPPDRFATRGPLHRHARFEPVQSAAAAPEGDVRHGLGCCAGVVRGRVRVVLDPKDAHLESGCILVARHTDPGWVMLFPLASGLLVERGSLLSHSAIVAREMGLPAVVGLPGLCEWLQTGDEVELDGRTGTVRKLQAV